ncbi:MAG: hypothetical protein L3J42_02110 [Hydrogenimonas sp.]|nr:hypothetical protein [Hydrogenimonas sp.]
MKKLLIGAIFLASVLYAEKADVIEAKVKKSYGGSYIAYVKIRHHDSSDLSDFMSEWEILDQNGTVITRRLEVRPKPGKEIIDTDLIGFKIPKGTTKLIFRAKCSKDGFGGKEFVIDFSDQENNSSNKEY